MLSPTVFPQNLVGKNQYGSVERSMNIFWRLTNLSMEWNMSLFLGSFVSHSDQKEYWEKMHKKMADSILANIKSLKGCWVKLGQFLSTKSGVLPSCYLEAFSQLQDYMPSSDFGEIIDSIETDLGYMDDIYKNFDSIPLASASIAQVHKAVLHDGTSVAIKVQHKSSEQNLLNDIEILKMISWLMNSAGLCSNICQYFDEYSAYAAKELDFTLEAMNMENASIDVEKSGIPIKVPKLVKHLCSRRVITMEYFNLHKLTDAEFVKANNVNINSIFYDIHDFAFFQILACGRFHSDPHPGNLQLVCEDGRIYPVFLDWGFTTYLNNIQRVGLCKIYKCIYTYDPMGCVSAFVDSGFDLSHLSTFRYEDLFEALIAIILSSYNKNLKHDAKKARSMTGHKRTQAFINEFFKKVPNYLPLTFKVLSEYQSISKTMKTYVPFLHLIYKNASHAIRNIYYSPINCYLSTPCGKSVLYAKLHHLKSQLSKDGSNVSAFDILYKACNLGFSRCHLVSRKINFPFPTNIMESRLSSLLSHLSKDSDNFIGCQVAVIRDGIVDSEISFGLMDKYEVIPISNDSLFPLFGLAHGLITTCILHLASIEKLNLEDPICLHWPEFKCNGKEYITIKDLLNNRSGITYPYTKYPSVEVFSNYNLMCNCIQNATIYKYGTNETKYSFLYSGWILSEIIRRITQMPVERFICNLCSMVGIRDSHMTFSNFGKETATAKKPAANAPDFDLSNSIIAMSKLYKDSDDKNTEETEPIQAEEVGDEAEVENGEESATSTDDENVFLISLDDFVEEKNCPNSPLVSRVRSNKEKLTLMDSKASVNEIMDSPKSVRLERFRSMVESIDLEQSVSNPFCDCYRDKVDEKDELFKRCCIPSSYCPTENRFIKLFRGSGNDSMVPPFAFNPGEISKEKNPDDATGPVLLDQDLCSVITPKPANSKIPLIDFVKTKRVKKLLPDYKETSTKLFNFSTNDLVRYGSMMIDVMNVNYEKIYNCSIPPMNGRTNALSLAAFYHEILNGSLIDSKYIQDVMNNNHVDKSLVSRFLTGLYKPCWSLGYQKFEFVNMDGKMVHGFGNSDMGGSIALAIPEYNLSIVVFVSHCNKYEVSQRVLDLVLRHYGLGLVGGPFDVDSSHIYKLMSGIKI
ncbi:hypothetical protein BEWA_020770 [Theileria equi strain WA]|uniref:Uncharacterized protein n=1 Tax=Theileria equi strain WA TaxID=1537102 RepID=L0AUJ7_THEEQ|nr:hypothetical protein BEWA_020770 [Theileria equi strain WA]AFZ79230.1 hypothetical protein BEWA_020770 [Theileria equi strain WA]|eukprot:XP_004828896.1 hypothetical protein BEWA_020770 [Theileria equi strain WA]